MKLHFTLGWLVLRNRLHFMNVSDKSTFYYVKASEKSTLYFVKASDENTLYFVCAEEYTPLCECK